MHFFGTIFVNDRNNRDLYIILFRNSGDSYTVVYINLDICIYFVIWNSDINIFLNVTEMRPNETNKVKSCQ